MMIEAIDPKMTPKPALRCASCDTETEYYVTFLTPKNLEQNFCWVCVQREDKGFNAKRGFYREARQGDIPR